MPRKKQKKSLPKSNKKDSVTVLDLPIYQNHAPPRFEHREHKIISNHATNMNSLFNLLTVHNSSSNNLPPIMFHVENFFKYFNRYTNLQSTNTKVPLENVVFRMDIIEENLTRYSEKEQRGFLYELALIKQEAGKPDEAIDYANKLFSIYEKTQPLSEEDEHRKLNVALLLLEIYREQVHLFSKLNKTWLQGLTLFIDDFLKTHPLLVSENFNFAINKALLEFTSHQATALKERNLRRLFQIHKQLKLAFAIIPSKDKLPTLPFYRNKIYKCIIDLANALSMIIIQLLNYDHIKISFEKRLVACKTARIVVEFLVEANNYIESNSEILKFTENNSQIQLKSITDLIDKRIKSLESNIVEQSIGKSNASTPPPANRETETEISQENQQQIITKQPLSNPVTILAKQIDQAEYFLLTRNLSEAKKLYDCLIKSLNNLDDMALKIRMLLGLADLNNLLGVQYTRQIDLMKHFRENTPITDADIDNINQANKYLESGITYCKQARSLITKSSSNDDLLLAEDMILTLLQKNLTLHKKMLDDYTNEMKALKQRLIAKKLWAKRPNKAETTTMLKKMLPSKALTDQLHNQLQQHLTIVPRYQTSSEPDQENAVKVESVNNSALFFTRILQKSPSFTNLALSKRSLNKTVLAVRRHSL